MSATLYRKYRPKKFSEIIGQNHIVRTLSNSIKNGRIGQAYLFTGPRGTGKTSIARIFAKTINCENSKSALTCEKCQACKIISSGKSLDIIEIDAASNTGVDNIRELRKTVAIANSSLKYKVYIIDEVHMLSTGAFNALLKTLEEPPAHVVFILATTEIHKVPETIISRCQRFDFTRLPIQDIIEKLSLISKAEKVNIEKEALELIAISAEGGMRDAESILGQIISLEDKNITLVEVGEILGTTDRKTAEAVAEMIINKNSSQAISKINDLLNDGYDLVVFNKSLINYLRQLMILKIDVGLKKYFFSELSKEQMANMEKLAKVAELNEIISAINLLLEAQKNISSFILPQLPLEIAIIKATHTFPKESQNMKHEIRNIEIQKQKPIDLPKKEKDEVKKNDYEASAETDKFAGKGQIIELSAVKSNWPKLLIDIHPFNHSLSALLSNCQPIKIEGNILVLATPYDFYRERLSDAKNRLTVEEVFSKILKSPVRISVISDKDLVLNKEEIEPKKSEQNSLLSSALEIMGGKVVEE